jgi:hypothetical protein
VRGEVVNYDDLYNYYANAEAQGQTIDAGQLGYLGVIDVLRLEGLARSQGGKTSVSTVYICANICWPQSSMW